MRHLFYFFSAIQAPHYAANPAVLPDEDEAEPHKVEVQHAPRPKKKKSPPKKESDPDARARAERDLEERRQQALSELAAEILREEIARLVAEEALRTKVANTLAMKKLDAEIQAACAEVAAEALLENAARLEKEKAEAAAKEAALAVAAVESAKEEMEERKKRKKKEAPKPHKVPDPIREGRRSGPSWSHAQQQRALTWSPSPRESSLMRETHDFFAQRVDPSMASRMDATKHARDDAHAFWRERGYGEQRHPPGYGDPYYEEERQAAGANGGGAGGGGRGGGGNGPLASKSPLYNGAPPLKLDRPQGMSVRPAGRTGPWIAREVGRMLKPVKTAVGSGSENSNSDEEEHTTAQANTRAPARNAASARAKVGATRAPRSPAAHSPMKRSPQRRRDEQEEEDRSPSDVASPLGGGPAAAASPPAATTGHKSSGNPTRPRTKSPSRSQPAVAMSARPSSSHRKSFGSAPRPPPPPRPATDRRKKPAAQADEEADGDGSSVAAAARPVVAPSSSEGAKEASVEACVMAIAASDHADLVRACLERLSELCRTDAKGRRAGLSTPRSRDASSRILVGLNGFSGVVQVFHAAALLHSAQGREVQRAGCQLLRRLCISESRRHEATAAGVIEVLLEAIGAAPRDAKVQASCCRTVHLIVRSNQAVDTGVALGDETRCMHAVNSGALEALAAALFACAQPLGEAELASGRPSDASVVRYATLAILSLTFGSVYRACRASQAGVIDALRAVAATVEPKSASHQALELARAWLSQQAKLLRASEHLTNLPTTPPTAMAAAMTIVAPAPLPAPPLPQGSFARCFAVCLGRHPAS